MKNTLAVAGIQNGTVIDHIQAGCGLKIVQQLQLADQSLIMTIGLNFLSKRLGAKDLVKVESYQLTENHIQKIAIFAAGATINIIKNFKIVEKRIIDLPKKVNNLFICPNQNCISYDAAVTTSFQVNTIRNKIYLSCHYCEKRFDIRSMQEK